MSDLLVRLYDLPPLAPVVAELDRHGIEIRRALAAERPQVTAFARGHGSEGWAAECDAAFARMPVACFVALERLQDRPAEARQRARLGIHAHALKQPAPLARGQDAERGGALDLASV